MKKIGIVTNIRSPYRKLQIEQVQRDSNYEISVYYTNSNVLGRKWDVSQIKKVNEYRLSFFSKKEHQTIHSLIKNNDLIFIGGYEKIKYITIAALCKLYKKPYVLIFDGIDPAKLLRYENFLKFRLKNFVIQNSSMIFGNGKISEQFFSEKFEYDTKKIKNQYLSVDNETIFKLSVSKNDYRKSIRNKLGIPMGKKVIIFSGRLIKRKNVSDILLAVNKLRNKDSYTVLILGDGEEKERLISLGEELGIHLVITGFISNQIDLFKHYFSGDLLILPSNDEPWGLVVNEAMAAGLPVIVSENCGCSLDLISENGYIFKTRDVSELAKCINYLYEKNLFQKYGLRSVELIENWNFENSSKMFIDLTENLTESIKKTNL